MKKIGFAIYTVQGGSGEPWIPESNRGTWSAGIQDLRTWLDLWQIAEGEHVEFIKFDKDGMFYVSVTPITSGRSGDFSSYWIYVPNSIDISGKEIVQLIYDVENSGKDANKLRDLFGKEYEEKEYKSKNQIDLNQESFAYRRYNSNEELAVILGENRYQVYYAKYKAIFLLNANSSTYAKTQLSDLTDKKINEVLIVFPPMASEVVKYFGHHHVSITFHGKTFDNGIRAPKGASIDVLAEREGFESIPCSLEECGNFKPGRIIVAEDKAIWRKKITPEMFVVKDEKGENLDLYTIKINGRSLSQGIILQEQECNQVQVTVTKPGYETKDKFLDFRHTENVEVTLLKEEHSFEFDVELENKEIGKLSFSSRKMVNKLVSPIVGYEWHGNCLVPNPFFVLKNRIIGALCGIGVLLAILFISWIYSNIESSNNFPWIKWHKEVPHPRPNYYGEAEDEIEDLSQTNPSKEESIGKAAEYLDNNQGWVKSEMEQFSCLEGLFEDMNNFHLRKIVGDRYAGLADASNEFKSIKDAAQQCLDNLWDPTDGGKRPKYNMTPDDYTINRINYRNWIGQSHSSQSGDGGNESSNNTHRGGTGSSGRSSGSVHAGGGGSSNSSTGNKESDV